MNRLEKLNQAIELQTGSLETAKERYTQSESYIDRVSINYMIDVMEFTLDVLKQERAFELLGKEK